jgi:hypothetical protein
MHKVSSGRYKAPFLADGSVPHWLQPCTLNNKQEVDWRDVEPFEATVKLDNMIPRGDGFRYEVVNIDTNAHYCIFNRDIRKLQRNFNIMNEVIHGWWKVQKYGQNYGIYYLGEEL